MLRILRCLLGMLGLTALCAIVAAAVFALWHHIIETPQQLESLLPGETRLYSWKKGNIFYKVLGSPEAPPLVLLHTPESGASGFEMRKIIQPLAQHYRVYAPDLLGFGLSDRPRRDYNAETYITLCHDFLAEVVKGAAILLASGLSCNYAVAVAARSPQLCTSLVLISPTAVFVTKQMLKPRRLLAELVTYPIVGSLVYPLLSTRPVLRSAIKRRHPDYTISNLDYLYATTHQLGAQYAPMAYLVGKLACDVSQQMETLQQPTLIIWGTQALKDVHSLPSHLPARSQVVLLRDTGMYLHEERPETVVANIEEWSKVNKVALAVASTPSIETSEATANSPSVAQDDVEEDVELPTIEAYCAKCKKKVPMQDLREVTMKNGRPALRGTCPVCGTGLFRIGRA